MSCFYTLHSVPEDRDLSRAAAEQHLMLQALSERQAAAQGSNPTRLVTWVQRAIAALLTWLP